LFFVSFVIFSLLRLYRLHFPTFLPFCLSFLFCQRSWPKR
jgi:hypothetical protein